MLIITEKSYYFTCKTCYPGYLWLMKSFSFFSSRDKPRGDTISISRSLKAVINFVTNVCLFPPAFANHLCCVFFYYTTRVVNPLKDQQVRENCSYFVRQNVTELQILFEASLWSSASSDRRNAKFLERCLQMSSLCNATLSFEKKPKKKPSLLLFLTTRFPCDT